MEIFAGSSLDWVSCIHVFMQVSLTSSAEFRNFIKLSRLKIAFKSWNSYKTWHEITRLSAPTQISHILLKVWLGWSRLRAVSWTLDTCSVDSRRPYPGVVDCGAHHAVQNLFLLGPATKLPFSRGRDAWHVTADTWHSVTIPPFCRQSQGESRPEWQQSSKMWQTTGGRQGARGDITITFGAEGLLWRFEVSQTECQNILSTKTTFQTWFSLLRHGHKTSISTEAR